MTFWDCKVCGERFEARFLLTEHLNAMVNDPDHKKVMDEAGSSPQPCPLCGGKVSTASFGEAGYVTACDKCEWLYSED
jgi:hypothetical protein